MIKKILVACLLSYSSFVIAASPCDAFIPYGYPKVTYNHQVLCRTSYLQIHNNDSKTGGISYEYLTPATIGTGNEPRTNNFRADIEVPRESRANPNEYTGTGFDKGHIAAAGNMREDGQSMSQSFFMSNIAPQFPNHNRGIWRGLEILTRSYVIKQNRNLFVITGTVFMQNPRCLPPVKSQNRQAIDCPKVSNLVWIPNGFFKVIIDKDNQDVIAFYIPNQEKGFKKLIDYRVSVCDLEKILQSGGHNIDLIPALSQSGKADLCMATGLTFSERIR